MSKKHNKNKQKAGETQQERVRRIAAEAGVIVPKGSPTPEEETKADAVSIPENIPDSAGDDVLSFVEELNKKKEELAALERSLREQEESLDAEAQRLSDEYIKNLGIDVPTAQEEVKEILAKAEEERKRIIEEAKETAARIEAEIRKKQAELDEIRKQLDAKEKALEALAEELSRKRIQLENDKISYRSEIGDEIAETYKKQIEEIDSFEAAKAKLEKKAAYLKDQYEEVSAELEQLQTTLLDYETLKRELNFKTETCNGLEAEIAKLRGQVKDLTARLTLLGSDPAAYKNQLASLEAEFTKLQDRLANMPGEVELADLRAKAEELEKLLAKYTDQSQRLHDAESELTDLRTKAGQVDDYIQYVRILTESKRQLQIELASLQEQYESENNNKFKALSAIDKVTPKPYPTSFNGSLSDIVTRFLDFAQNEEKPLYYEASTISAFLAWMASTKTMVLEGLSGTGKTSLPLAFERFAGWYTPRISVQSAWKDRNDLVGFFNDFKKEYKETEFLKDLYIACQNPERPALIVLDEMNLSRIEYYFADFLSALEEPNPSRRYIDLLSDQTTSQGMPKLFENGGKLPIRDNVWFIGTANKDDSTFAITDKVYDRAGVIYFSDRGKEPTKARPRADVTYVSYASLQRLFETAKRCFDPTAKARYEEIAGELIDSMSVYFEINLGNRIINQLDAFVPVYLACIGSSSEKAVSEAIDEFFPHKVLRKLEGLYDANTKKNIGEMIKVAAKYNLTKTRNYLNTLQAKID